MISYLRHDDIDKNLWDKRVSESPHGIVYAYSWYLDIVSPGWNALVTQDYKQIFPLTRRNKAMIEYLFQPYFTQQLGLFSNDTENDNARVEQFLKSIPAKFRLIEIQLNTSNKISASEGFEIYPRRTHHLSLSNEFPEIRKNFSENLRRNIRKSESALLEIDECTTAELINMFINNRGGSIENLKPQDYETLTQLVDEAEKRNLIERIACRSKDGQLIAGAIFIRSVHSWIFLFSATTEEGKKTGAMSRLISSFIEEHSSENKYLDFEGSMDENLSRFYKSFGSEEVVYLQIRKNNLPLFIRWLK